jgi:hypothetical protein
MPYANREDYLRYQRKYNKANKAARVAGKRASERRHPERRAFGLQKSSAKQRGIEFLFSFAEWVAWWGDDFAKRGRGAYDLCMARDGDTGPYEVGNVYKATNAENRADWQGRG